ncbi:MAG: amino acid adenylation domain-containing protein, partial [Chloroflexales bacterium]|nr:amino acid adenylation domain-containing protein [Chloroflexales bacterium]
MLRAQDERWPLSAAQYGIWLGQQLDRQSPIYNAGECIEICGPVDPLRFEAALRQAIGEAETLRMRFVMEDDEPRQMLAPSVDWALQMLDVSAEADPWQTALTWMRDDLGSTVDLSRGPLFAEALFKAAPDRFFWYQRVHHIAMDGFGFSLVAQRVAEIYTALSQGKGCNHNPFPSLRRVVDEDLAYQSSRDYERDRAFWMQRFADRPAPLSLAKHTAPMSANFVRHSSMLSVADWERLQATARQIGVNWPDIVIATTAVYLHQHSGATEVVLGLPVMGRLGSVALRIPSMVMNIAPLRVRVQPQMTPADLARQVAQELRLIRPYQRYRYEQLRRDLQLVGGERRLFGPVVNIMPFDYHLRFAEHHAVAHNISAGPVEDLSIGFYARSDGNDLRIDFDANPACYSREELAAHQRRFLELLDRLIGAADQAIGSSVKQFAVAAGGATPAAMLNGGALGVPPRSVVELVLERARETPHAIAVEEGARCLNYAELTQAAQRLAFRLVALGVEPDTLVAIALPRGIDAIVSMLGVLCAGAGYLPLDSQGPPSRMQMVLEDAQPAFLLTTAQYADLVDCTAAPRVVLLATEDTAAPEQEAVFVPRPEATHLAYVIYTSGSTGRPNGVMIQHGALANFVAGATQRYAFRRDDRVLQFAPLHFDASVEEIFLTLCAGATLVVRNDEMLQSLTGFLAACAEQKISVLDLPTAFWHELAYSVTTGAATLPATVRTVIIGGEAALPERVARWREIVGSAVTLLNTYGPTEAAVVATVATLSAAAAADDATSTDIPIGRPLPGVRAVVLDKHGVLVAPGVVGELHLLGAGLASGYLGRPELNAQRFVTLTQLPDCPRAYRTGDLVRVREDGQLLFVGRVDDEFKISGHRVNPAEIETALLSYPGVREAAVVGQTLTGGAKRLIAHVVATAPPPNPTELRRHAQAILPAAMTPSAFVFSDRLPKTASGKVDRTALRDSVIDEPAAAVAPMSELEHVVLRVWGQVLGAADLSTQDDFFDRGGQSLQAIQTANRLGIELGREVPVALLFRHPTVADLTQALEQKTSLDRSSLSLPAIMFADAKLPVDIVLARLPPAASTQRLRCVLLSGATGFVGVHLLDELLRQTDAQIVCLVRADSAAQALERIRSARAKQRLADAAIAERVRAIPADLTQPRFGLNSEQFHELAAECDAIYHNAATVSVMREYQSVRAVNVISAREMLSLAATGRIKPFHYVSSLAVAPSAAAQPEVAEAFLAAHLELQDGYRQSKWAAEHLVQQAGERGFPVAVYRLGRVVGASDTGFVNEQDIFWRLLRTGIPLGMLPKLDIAEVWTPVDFVARAIVHLSRGAPPL